MRAFHEVTPDQVGSVIRNDLSRTSRGDKGDDRLIIKTDTFLDRHCPQMLIKQNVSRDDSIYAYLGEADMVFDIVTGAKVSLSDFIVESKQVVLELILDPARCFVSDLDTYDALKNAIEHHEGGAVLEKLAVSHWRKLKPLSGFQVGDIRRPEIMVTYDIQPDKVQVLS